MREILFRGKRTDNDEWACGFAIDSVLRDSIFNYITQSIVGYYAKVYRSTVGQFTGLLDKTGTKIFEHDIVRCEFNSAPPMNGKVVFENGAFGLRWKHHGSGVENFAAFECICNVEYTVIGNIHDNGAEDFKNG